MHILPIPNRFYRRLKHTDDRPSVTHADGTREWRVHGRLHRENGPAVEKADRTREWWAHDRKVRVLPDPSDKTLDRAISHPCEPTK